MSDFDDLMGSFNQRLDDASSKKDNWDGVVCHTCKKGLPTRHIKIGDYHYHETCFVCHECKSNAFFF